MAISQGLLGEFDHEMANTRKSLERVPDAKFNWKPHTKSMSMGALATHIASIPHWGKLTLDTPNFDVNPPGGPQARQPELKSKAEVLAFFDKSVPEARAAIANASDRAMIMNHMIHHRAQLGVYLRLNDLPVPSIYGPSADEGNM